MVMYEVNDLQYQSVDELFYTFRHDGYNCASSVSSIWTWMESAPELYHINVFNEDPDG